MTKDEKTMEEQLNEDKLQELAEEEAKAQAKKNLPYRSSSKNSHPN